MGFQVFRVGFRVFQVGFRLLQTPHYLVTATEKQNNLQKITCNLQQIAEVGRFLYFDCNIL